MAAKGQNHGQARLSDSEVKEIYKAKGSTRRIAAQYNVSHATVYFIKVGKTWKHITQGLKNDEETEVENFNNDLELRKEALF